MKMSFPIQVRCAYGIRLCSHCCVHAVRLSALDLVRSFTEDSELAGPCYSAIIAAINKHFQEALPSASSHWWKVCE